MTTETASRQPMERVEARRIHDYKDSRTYCISATVLESMQQAVTYLTNKGYKVTHIAHNPKDHGDNPWSAFTVRAFEHSRNGHAIRLVDLLVRVTTADWCKLSLVTATAWECSGE